ncbi:MAG: hypothetical protein MUC39_05445 [Candidatus Omnitrophica bacterium]|nr:hypothetical protein [Candidatus Omnitrophota bacterium]
MFLLKKTNFKSWAVIIATLLCCPYFLYAAEKTIESDQAKLIMDFSAGLNIPDGDTLKVVYTGSNSDPSALLRDTSGNPSYWGGNFWSNYHVLFVNTKGITFGANANIEAASFIASTLNIDNNDFLNGKYNFYKEAGTNGYIINKGRISTNIPGGYICLLSSTIDNQYIIEANLGTIILASGEKMTLALDDSSQISVVVAEEAKDGLVGVDGKKVAIRNSGTISADGGKVILTAKVLNNVFDYSFNNTGVIKACSLTSHNGVVRLEAEGAPAINIGKIEAGDVQVKIKDAGFINKGQIITDGFEGLPNGGKITLQAITILQRGLISANAAEQGTAGQIEIISQDSTVLDEASTTEARALGLVGNGGRILINSTGGNTTVNKNAVIDVSAGAISGNGGFIEVSAFEQVGFYGVLNGRAPPGFQLGTAIIDPASATIGNPGYTYFNLNTWIWATSNIVIVGNVTLGNGVTLYLLADHKSATPGDWDDGVGAIINNGTFIISAASGATSTCLNLKAGSGIGTVANPIRTDVHILSSQINPNSISGSINIVQGSTPLIITYILSKGDVSLQAGQDITLGYIAALGSVTLISDSGSIINANSGNLINIISTSLILRAATGIGSSNPLKARVSYLSAYNSTSGNIRFYNYGQSLTIVAAVGEDYGVKNNAPAADVEIKALPLIYIYNIDGNLVDWNVLLDLSAALEKGYLDANLPLGSGFGVEWATEDNAGNNTGWQFVGPGYSYYGNDFDAETIYFDNDQNYAYLVIVQGLPISGGTALGNPWFYSGDIGIDINGDGVYEYAIDVSAYDAQSRTTQLYGNVVWNNVYYSQFAESNPWTINSGIDLGAIDFVYSGNQNSHYVLEAKIPLSLLGVSAGNSLAIHWTQQCGNDSLKLTTDLNSVNPQPNLILNASIYSNGGNVLLSAAGSILDDSNDTTVIQGENIALNVGVDIGGFNNGVEDTYEMLAPMLDVILGSGHLTATSTGGGNIYISAHGSLNLLTSNYTLTSSGEDTEIVLANLTPDGDLTIDASPLGAGVAELRSIDFGAAGDVITSIDFPTIANHLGLHAFRNVEINNNISSMREIEIEADIDKNDSGAITQAADTTIGLGVEELRVKAAQGINLPNTNVSKLQAKNTTSGDINIINARTLTLTNLDGRRLNEGFDDGELYSIWNKGIGSVFIRTIGTGADIISPEESLCVVMAHGNITLDAAHNLILCDGTDSSKYGDVVTTAGTILLKAGNDIITKNDTYIYHTGNDTINLEAGNNITVAHIGFDLEIASVTTKGTVNITAGGSIFDDSVNVEKTQGDLGNTTPSWIKANAIHLSAGRDIGGFNDAAGTPQLMAIPMLDVFLGPDNLTATAGGNIYIAEHLPGGLTITSADKYQLNGGDPSTESEIIFADLAGGLIINTPLSLVDNWNFLAVGNLNINAAILSSANDLCFIATEDVFVNANVELSGIGYYRNEEFRYGPWIGFVANADQNETGKVIITGVNIIITHGGYIDFYGADIEINPLASINAEGNNTVPDDSGIGFQPNNGTNPNIFLGNNCINLSLYSFILNQAEFDTLKADYVEFVEYALEGDMFGNVAVGDITVGTLVADSAKVSYLCVRTKGRILNQDNNSLLTAENLGLKAFGIKPDDSGSYDTAIGTADSPLNIDVVNLKEALAGQAIRNKAYFLSRYCPPY